MDLGRFLQIRMDLSRFASRGFKADLLHFDLSGCMQDLCDFVEFVWICARLNLFNFKGIGWL